LIKQGKKKLQNIKSYCYKANNAEITDNKNKMKLLQDQIGLRVNHGSITGKAAMLRNTVTSARFRRLY
jgi:hypothetical protein